MPIKREHSYCLFTLDECLAVFESYEQEQKLNIYVKVRTETLICKFKILIMCSNHQRGGGDERINTSL